MCGLHGFELDLPKRPIPYVEDRPVGRCHIWTPEDDFLDAFQGYQQIALAHED